ncbi:MAG: antibiotic biosynthesis monooxygenase [Deltaproteobacteria bacterium CG_4_9_14_3_um_filter_63_12]|nr:MAG: antibiotic biosynthesis monooxygenase [Deltaproteobacteria bacterium CG_4_9_14_3_um_filter_63_12]
MIATIVHVHIKADQIEAFKAASILNHEGSTAEPGNRRFDVLQNREDPARFVLYEAYDSEAHAAAHKSTEHYKVWREEVEAMMEKPRKALHFDAIRPEFY